LQNRCKNQISTVVLYFPSIGTYYLPQFVADTNQLWSKGLWLHNNGLATKKCFHCHIFFRKTDGMPDEDGQLWTFTDLYYVDVSNTKTPILTMYP